MDVVTTVNIEGTNDHAKTFLHTLKPSGKSATVIGLSGNLGSGKTTFVKAVAKQLGLKQTVTSPTFVIEKIYKLKEQPFDHLIHIDAYRLESAKELIMLGWKEILQNPKNLIMIEWPERVEDILPPESKTLSFSFVDEGTRTITTSHA